MYALDVMEETMQRKIGRGLGFKVLDDFNTALLSKQLWRLLDNPDSLFAKVFDGLYYRNSNPMEQIRSYSPSYRWKSIISTRLLGNKGLIKRVGSKASISVWNDTWIPAHHPRPATCKDNNYYPSFRANHLIDRHTKTWNRDLLSATIVPEDVSIISSKPLGTTYRPDHFGWLFKNRVNIRLNRVIKPNEILFRHDQILGFIDLISDYYKKNFGN